MIGLALAAQPPSQPPDARSIVRKSLEKDRLNFERARDYTYIQRIETRELSAKGAVRKTESETFDVLMLGDRPYRKLIEKNDKPLSLKEAAKVQKEFDKTLAKRQSESDGERRKEVDEDERRRREGRLFAQEVPEAFDFTLLREEAVDGLPAWVIAAKPRPEYRPANRQSSLLKHFRGTLWIDQKDYQWVKVEAETVDRVTFGWVVARLEPGTRLTFTQTRINDQVWLPSHAYSKVDARIALFKRYNAEIDVTWSNYRKFQTDSRVLSSEPLEP
jgi:hypothetical protein